MSRVLHHVPQWLPPTERFVSEQIAHSRYPGIVTSRRRPTSAARVRRIVSLERVPDGRAVERALAAVAVAARSSLVHVHFGYRLRDARLVLGRRPVVVSLFGHDATAFPLEWPSYYGRVLPHVDAVVVPSQFLAAAAVRAGAPARRVHVIPPGVDLDWFRPQPLPTGAPEVAFIGRFVEKKGLDVLLAAWPAVRRAVPGARLRLVGAGPLAPPAGGGVDVVAGTGREVVREALTRAAVVCSPSRTAADGDAESLLLVNLEAQALGRPVVTTDHAAVPEFVSAGETALVVPENDPGRLTEALVAVLSDRMLAARLAAAGPAFAARFALGRCAARIDDEVYAPLLREVTG